jgi:hypothetical protein
MIIKNDNIAVGYLTSVFTFIGCLELKETANCRNNWIDYIRGLFFLKLLQFVK